MRTNAVIVGAGIAGLNTALQLSTIHPDWHITVVAKSDEAESNSMLAQGGVAVSTKSQKDQQGHIDDTMIAGDYFSDTSVVTEIIQESTKIADQLQKIGVSLDKTQSGNLHKVREGGHGSERIIHARDTTGAAIMQALIRRIRKQKNITVLHNYLVIDLLTTGNKTKCVGIHALDQTNGDEIVIYSPSVVLATGGIGVLYGLTTNSSISTGDGIAMALRAGASVTDLEFIQFHPTAFYQKRPGKLFLISEAVRGFGATLTNASGERFMSKYDSRLDLAPRDIVARAIASELDITGYDHVFLDCTHIDRVSFQKHFPSIYNYCLSQNIDPCEDPVPVVPAQHYICGGIATDLSGRTSIDGLFACGECARTGFHGANRLASNSLLEALVISSRVAKKIADVTGSIQPSNDCSTKKLSHTAFDISPHLHELQEIMQREVGIIRTNYGLEMALEKIETIEFTFKKIGGNSSSNPQHIELRNMLDVSRAIVQQCRARKENLGGHYNLNLVGSTNVPG